MNAHAHENVVHIHSQGDESPSSKPAATVSSEAGFSPMIRLEQASDYYRISIVMPKIEVKEDWFSWDRGKLRLAIPEANYRNSPTSKPGFIRWINLPADAKQCQPEVHYSEGCLRVIVPRKGIRV
jgi:HSP20 family molecular chaperone IbpA